MKLPQLLMDLVRMQQENENQRIMRLQQVLIKIATVMDGGGSALRISRQVRQHRHRIVPQELVVLMV